MKPIRHLHPAGKAIFKDRYTSKAKELLTPWQSGLTGEYAIIGLPLSKPSISHSGASFAPGAIRDALQGFSTYSGELGEDLTASVLDFGDFYMDPTDVVGNQQRLYEGMIDVYATSASENWFVLGGDHSISHASIRAFTEQYGDIGVIQFDAHHDLRNTVDGGPTNGTPFRRLLADGSLKGEQLVQIGIRDFSNAKAYDQFAKDNGIQVYTMQDVLRQSLLSILEKELLRLSKQTSYIYLSLDMDVLDQAFAPGCPAIGPGGMDSMTLLQGIDYAVQWKEVKAMDIVEIDPTIDIRHMTSRIAAYAMLQYMKGKQR